jgi:cytochrome c-type biogenesis protein CcmE
MKSRSVVKFVVGAVVIGGGLVYFMVQAMQSSYSYYYSVDEFLTDKTDGQSHSLRLAGKVKPGSVSRDMEKMQLDFVLKGSGKEIPVNYGGTVPENFTEDIEVVVQGKLDTAGTFQAKTLMTRCESKYQAKVNP